KCGEAITARKAGNVRGYLVVNGLKTVFENSKAVIYKQSEIVGVAKRQRGLYELEIYLDTKTAKANLSLHEKEDLWHKRYGHNGNESLQKIINLDMVNALQNKTPAELWYGTKLDVSKLRVFGCIAYLHTPGMKRGKFDSRCQKLVMVGYAVNGYRLWNPQTGTIINGRYVIFVENKFMFNDSIYIDESFEEEREVEDQTDEESGKVESARNTGERRRPTWFDDYDMEQAMENKMQALVKNRRWGLVPLPECKKATDCKWVYKIKVDGNGDTHYKARLVAKGF
ncbi:hypothetical protein ILUMI_17561, partial [Ignelater luminosus]